jgi:putative endonuclease
VTSAARRVDDSPRFVPAKGAWAEALARRALEARGWRTLATHVVVRGGEIDLVMLEGDTIVFVEVRHRSRADYGDAAASIGTVKRRRLRRAAAVWLARHEATDRSVRFDVVLLDGPAPAARLTHLRDAL